LADIIFGWYNHFWNTLAGNTSTCQYLSVVLSIPVISYGCHNDFRNTLWALSIPDIIYSCQYLWLVLSLDGIIFGRHYISLALSIPVISFDWHNIFWNILWQALCVPGRIFLGIIFNWYYL